jgi:ribosomal protein S18 acetylase RimI-like enzyme
MSTERDRTPTSADSAGSPHHRPPRDAPFGVCGSTPDPEVLARLIGTVLPPGQDVDVPKTAGRLLASVDDETAAALARLLPQVSNRAAPLTQSRLKAVLASPSTRIIVGTLDDRVVGMALLCLCTTLTGRFGLIEEVAVDESARGHHVGIEVMVTLLELAADLDLDFVELTSRESREAANALYQSLGFERRNTNVYRHRLNPLPARR